LILFSEQVEQDAGGQIGQFLGVAMGFAPQACQVAPQAVIVTFYGIGVRLALQVVLSGEDDAVGMPEVGAEGDLAGMRKLRIQTLGRFGATIAQCPAADFLGSTINSPPEPARIFFLPT
jgi:hypothetical protein